MNARLLKVFRAVMSCQTTVGASRLLGVSQPAVSNALGQLESELGFKLFNRHGNRLVAREEAKTLFTASEAMFLYSEALEQTIEDIKENRMGHVRVSATPQLGHSVLAGAIQRFMVGKPEVKVFFDVVDSYKVIESVETLAADLGLAIALEPELKDALSMERVASFNMVCVVPTGHPLTARKFVIPADLAPYPLIGLSTTARLNPLVVSAFREAGLPYRVAVEVRYSETACMLVSAGAGIAVVDEFSANVHARRGEIVRLAFRPTITVSAWAVAAKDRPLSRLAQALLVEIKLAVQAFLATSSPSKEKSSRSRQKE
jgi:DNA-binding transcriptional LysR family regulator